MAVSNFRTFFDPTYQEIFNKLLVGKAIANTRFKANLSSGDTVTRMSLDLSAVPVRTITAHQDRTLDAITDSEESLTINYKNGMTFAIDGLEKLQAGSLMPEMVAAENCAKKLSSHLDAFILYETVNAYSTFDTGDLTTASSTGVPVTLSSTTVPQLVARAYAKLESNNQLMTDTCWVLDPYSLADFSQYLMGKQFETTGDSTFKNGLKGTDIYGSKYYTSNNLTGEATLVYTGSHVNAQAVTINGITFTAVTTIGSTAGNFLASASDSTTGITNLAGLINAPGTTSANQVALSAADQAKLAALNVTATATSATVLTIVAKGSGRLILTEAQTNATWATNFVHAYFGKKGAIDVVIQEEIDLLETQPELRRAKYFLLDIVAGIKTFSDGKQKFLDVKISA